MSRHPGHPFGCVTRIQQLDLGGRTRWRHIKHTPNALGRLPVMQRGEPGRACHRFSAFV
jgi:hypothetical protein